MARSMHAATWALPVLGLVLLVAPSLVATAPGTPLSFGPMVQVMNGSGEPSLAIGPQGDLYASTLAGVSDRVAKSADGGATWTVLPVTNAPWGGADDHVAVAPDDTVYLVGQWAAVSGFCMAVAQGLLGGTAWATQPLACPLKSGVTRVDRPWLAISAQPSSLAPHKVYLYFHDPCCNGRHIVLRSDDHGLTWALAGVPTTTGGFPGNAVVDDGAGLVYVATMALVGDSYGPTVFRSANQGQTWTPLLVASRAGGDEGLNHFFLAKDAAGNLYVAWADNLDSTGLQIWFSRSLNHGDTWSAPVKVTTTTGTHVFPTIAAGSAGRVVVAWYETSVVASPNAMPFSAMWFPKAAGTWSGQSSTPTFTYAAASGVANHRGSLCTQGASCGNVNRALLDFFTVQIDDQDRANLVWGKDLGPPSGTFFARSL